ncbi:MAG TPA: peptidoglycan DD-metalloendopeptidase family protein [Actinomycetaceae bacterium]|nr:peptidoglycan DD-metalloendopeptidase family protein [Actinomycetaceae bacterium]
MRQLIVVGVLAVGTVLGVASHDRGAVSADTPPWEPGPSAASFALDYTWPTLGPRDVIRPFEQPTAPWSAAHRGADLAVSAGEPILAPAGGVVAFAGWVVDRGVVSVQHPDGLRTTFEPVIGVLQAGDPVAPGDVIGHLADGDHCQNPCLHFGARRATGEYVDPMALIGATREVRLLPMG